MNIPKTNISNNEAELGLAITFEQTLVPVTIILRYLNDGYVRVRKVRHHMFEPVPMHAIVGVDGCDYSGVLGHVFQQVIQGAGLEAA